MEFVIVIIIILIVVGASAAKKKEEKNKKKQDNNDPFEEFDKPDDPKKGYLGRLADYANDGIESISKKINTGTLISDNQTDDDDDDFDDEDDYNEVINSNSRISRATYKPSKANAGFEYNQVENTDINLADVKSDEEVLIEQIKARTNTEPSDDYEKKNTKLDISHYYHDRAIQTFYTIKNINKIEAFNDKIELYSKNLRLDDASINIRISTEHKLAAINCKISNPIGENFKDLYFDQKDKILFNMILDLDNLILDVYIKNPFQLEEGNYLFAYPNFGLKKINVGDYSFGTTKALTEKVFKLLEAADVDLEHYI